MSGVFGYCGADNMPPELLDNMGRSMKHRDWYMVDSWSQAAPPVGLGRIGIGIFNAEAQPVWNADRTLAVVMAGELIRVRREARAERDEETVLGLYAAYGRDFVHYMDGAFVVAVWDASAGELVIANDRFGLYPLHYAHVNKHLIFAPEIKGILCDPAVKRDLDMTAVAEYLRFQMLLGRKTFFDDVKLLPGGTILSYRPSADHLMLETYWDFGHIPEPTSTLSFEEAVEEGSRLLRDAMHRRSTGRVGVYLSGGMDSRLILGYLSRMRPGLPTVTFGLNDSADVNYAAMLAEQAGSDHHYMEFVDGRWVQEYVDFHMELTEGAHSWIHSHGMSTLAHARQFMEINLNGLGGDALDVMDPLLTNAPNDHVFLTRFYQALLNENTWPSLDEGEERLLYSPRVASRMIGAAFESLRCEMDTYAHLDYSRRAMNMWFEADRRMFQYYTVFGRSHIEQRFPFFDYEYFDFMASLPIDMVLNRRLRRAIILKEMPELAAVPYDRDSLPIVGSKTVHVMNKAMHRAKWIIRKTMGLETYLYSPLYADYENWLRGELRSWGEGLLLGESLAQRDLFDRSFLHSLWERHQLALEENTIGKIAPVMSLEMFLRRYYD